jgi:exosortase
MPAEPRLILALRRKFPFGGYEAIMSTSQSVASSSVISSAAPVEQSRPVSRSWGSIVWLVLALSALWLICFRHLSAEWSYNEQYSYGWFVPIFALYLFWLRWEDRPEAEIRRQSTGGETGDRHSSFVIRHSIAVLITVVALFLLFPIRLIEVANPDWRPISWLHTIIAVALTLLVLWRLGGKPWLRHFAFPVMFVLIAVPWISAIEQPIIQGLMPTLASIATEALSLFGIPAEVQGNLVRINGGVVGVNEACSGVRSLQTSIMIGLLFGELKRLGIGKRLVLIAGAIGLAFIANCGRAFFLVWVAATHGLSEVERWHDIAGYTIVGLVFFGCLGLTALLARNRKPGTEESLPPHRSALTNHLSRPLLFAVLAWLLLVEVAVECWYRAHETNLPRTAQWSVRWPKSEPDFRELKIDERTRGILHYDKGQGATWRTERRNSDVASAATAQPISLLYFFRWEPGHNSALLANAHRPDVCLPATGWQQTKDLGVREYRVSPDLNVPFRHFVFEHNYNGRTQFAHAFYCVWEDRVRPNDHALEKSGMAGGASTWNRDERMGAVIEGRRHLGQQVLEYLLMELRPGASEGVEEAFAQQLPELIQPATRSPAE